jgi:hypothetical protein
MRTTQLLIVIVMLGAGLFAALVIPPISKWRNLKRAKASGARWVGMAQIEADEAHPVAAVQRAMSGVGTYYGSFSISRGLPRSVSGLLYVETDQLRWEPRIWLGRGKARPWRIPLSSVVGVTVTRLPPPAVGAFSALLCTTEGNERVQVVDPDGLRGALPAMPD